MSDALTYIRRLETARRAPVSPASYTALAFSGADDDELEEITRALGAPEPRSWGIADMTQAWMSREPDKKHVASISTLQARLKSLRYLPADFPVDGYYSPQVHGAFRRWESAGIERHMSGDRPGSASVPKWIEWLGYTMPSRAWQGVVGTAKGIRDQAPETVERVGLAGGAAGGAIVGATVGSVVPVLGTGIGALAGGIIGGAAGFLGDILGEDEGEEDMDGMRQFLDALSPYEEYRREGGGRAFMEDLGLVLTVASAIKGGGMVGAGLKGAFSAGGLSVAKGAAVGVPKLGSSRTLAAAIRGNAAAGGTIGAAEQMFTGGDLGDIATGAVVGAGASLALGRTAVGPTAANAWMKWVGKHGLAQQLTRPMLKNAQKIYTGASAASIGGRMFGGMFIADEKDTAIEAAIEKAGTGPEWMDYTLGLVLNPTQLLPFRASELAKGANRALGSAALEPWIRRLTTVRDESGGIVKQLSRGQAREEFFKGGTKPELDLMDKYLRLGAGIDARAAKRTRELAGSADPLRWKKKKWTQARSSIISEVLESPDKARDIVADTFVDDTMLDTHLSLIEGKGSGLDKWSGYVDASRAAQDLTDDWHAGLVELDVGEAKFVKGGSWDDIKKQSQARDLQMKSRGVRKDAEAPGLSPEARAAKLEEAEELLTRSKALRKEVRGKFKTDKDFKPNIIPAREDYLTRQDLLGLADEYDNMADDTQAAFGAFKKDNANPIAQGAAAERQAELNAFLNDLEAREAISPEVAAKGRQPKKVGAVSKYLRDHAEQQASLVQNAPAAVTEQLTSRGYKLVATGENVIKINDTHRLLELTGINDYSRREAFFATVRSLGLDPKVRTDDALVQLKAANIAQELQYVMDRRGVPITGKRGVRQINKYVHDRNHPGRIRDENVSSFGPFVIREKPGKGSRVALFKVDPRQLKIDDYVEALDLERLAPSGTDPREIAAEAYKAVHRGAAFGSEVRFQNPITAGREIGRALSINGLLGFSDWMRGWHIENPARAATLTGATAGFVFGGQGEEGFDVAEGLKGAAIGAGATAALHVPSLKKMLNTKFKEGTYGYLPQHLHNLVMAVRYTLSPSFDLSRRVEQNFLGALEGVNGVIMRPHRYIGDRTWKKSPYRNGEVSGDEAWNDSVRFWDDLNESKSLGIADDLERRMFQTGVTGFSPRNHEAAQAWVLFQNGVPRNQIRAKVLKIGRYGEGRSALEKSANFIFFPFSFQKKLLAAVGDWMYSAPARALLIHEGFRRFHEVGADDKFHDAMERWLPIADELKQLNNLSYGLSPGRFFLQGVDDNKSDVGKAMQIIASVFAPSGAATPLAQAAGKMGDRALHLFSPVVVTGEKLPDFMDIVESLAPMVRDSQDYWDVGRRQVTAVTEGGDPYWQQTAYLDAKRAERQAWDGVAQVFDYADADSLFASDAGAELKTRYDAAISELRGQFPSGAELADHFENTIGDRKKALYDMANDPDRSQAEDAIVSLAEVEMAGKRVAREMNLSWEQVYPMVMEMVRAQALTHRSDKRFAELYKHLYEADYGPIERIA